MTTLRSGPAALSTIEKLVEAGNKPDMVVLSPGPGNPKDFALSTSIEVLTKHSIPGFGVCLGLQGMVEHFGGELGVLDYPMHGKPSSIMLTDEDQKTNDSMFAGLPSNPLKLADITLVLESRTKVPDCLDVTALTEDDIVMSISRHKTVPFVAV